LTVRDNVKKNLKKKSKIKYILKFPSPKRSKEPFLSNIVSIVGTIFPRGVATLVALAFVHVPLVKKVVLCIHVA
jgi:hypothetical protein